MKNVRETSRDALKALKSGGFFEPAIQRVFDALVDNGPCTASELYFAMGMRNHSQSNVHTRLGELRDRGSVEELPKRKCSRSGRECIVWDVTGKYPVKLDKPMKHKCATCNGKGFIVERQTRFDI